MDGRLYIFIEEQTVELAGKIEAKEEAIEDMHLELQKYRRDIECLEEDIERAQEELKDDEKLLEALEDLL